MAKERVPILKLSLPPLNVHPKFVFAAIYDGLI
jgi:hypothetical protein